MSKQTLLFPVLVFSTNTCLFNRENSPSGYGNYEETQRSNFY